MHIKKCSQLRLQTTKQMVTATYTPDATHWASINIAAPLLKVFLTLFKKALKPFFHQRSSARVEISRTYHKINVFLCCIFTVQSLQKLMKNCWAYSELPLMSHQDTTVHFNPFEKVNKLKSKWTLVSGSEIIDPLKLTTTDKKPMKIHEMNLNYFKSFEKEFHSANVLHFFIYSFLTWKMEAARVKRGLLW